jgi:hypothetical protein
VIQHSVRRVVCVAGGGYLAEATLKKGPGMQGTEAYLTCVINNIIIKLKIRSNGRQSTKNKRIPKKQIFDISLLLVESHYF